MRLSAKWTWVFQGKLAISRRRIGSSRRNRMVDWSTGLHHHRTGVHRRRWDPRGSRRVAQVCSQCGCAPAVTRQPGTRNLPSCGVRRKKRWWEAERTTRVRSWAREREKARFRERANQVVGVTPPLTFTPTHIRTREYSRSEVLSGRGTLREPPPRSYLGLAHKCQRRTSKRASRWLSLSDDTSPGSCSRETRGEKKVSTRGRGLVRIRLCRGK